jgi:hypothetical protein
MAPHPIKTMLTSAWIMVLKFMLSRGVDAPSYAIASHGQVSSWPPKRTDLSAAAIANRPGIGLQSGVARTAIVCNFRRGGA